MSKEFEKLDVIDDYLMRALASNKESGEAVSKLILSTLLQRKIGKVKVVAQRVLPGIANQFRGIRMDVEVQEIAETEPDEVVNVYDVEPHLQKEKNYPKHNRFYQAKIDSRNMRKGEKDFSRMPNLYVITILNKDLFGEDYMVYTFRNQCLEVPKIEYEDGLQFIYFYTGGHLGGNQAIQNMLRYLQESTEANVADDATRKLHEHVTRIKEDEKERMDYMTWEEYQEIWKEDIKDELREEVKEELRKEVTEDIKDELREEVKEEIKDELREEVKEEVFESGEKAGLKATVSILKSIYPSFELVYDAISKNETYAKYSEEEVRQYY